MTIELDGVLYQIVEFQHIKLGRGSAQMRMKLRNVRKGDLVEKTFQAGDRFQRARLDHRDVQYMYRDGTHYHFMDTATYDQLALDEDLLGDAVNYLTDGMTVILSEYEGSPIGVDLPASVALTVTETDLGLKGDTATGATKPATVDASSAPTTCVRPGPETRICAWRRSSAASPRRVSSRANASAPFLRRRDVSASSRARSGRSGVTSRTSWRGAMPASSSCSRPRRSRASAQSSR